MESINKLQVKQILWDKEMLNSRLEFNMSGKNINYVIANTIKRVATTYVPVYAFTNIDITENTSVFNNNMLKLRLQNIPVFGISTKESIFKLSDEVIAEEETMITSLINMDDIDLGKEKKFNSTSLNQLTLYLDYTNTSENIISATTKHCKFYVAEKQIESPYPVEVPIVDLQPGQKIKLSAITTLGIEDTSAIFSPVSIFTYRMNNENDYDVIFESKGQLDEKRILNITFENIDNILDNFITLVPEENDMVGMLELQKGNHTIGNMISVGMMQHNDIEFAGYNMPHPLDSKIVFHYKLKSGSIRKVCNDIVDYYKKVFNELKSNINKNIN